MNATRTTPSTPSMIASRTMRLLAFAFALVLGTRGASAQIVNVQGALATPPEDDGVTGKLELKVDWRTGNNSLVDLGGGGSLLAKRGDLLVLLVARGGYGTSRGLTLTKRSFEHLRFRYAVDCRWRWEAFAQHEYDAFRRIVIRGLVGSGPAFQLVESTAATVLLGAAYMFELEELDSRDGTSDAGERSVFHRASFYVTGTHKLGEGVSITETIYVQPRLTHPSDVRVFAEIAVTSKLSKRLALSDALIFAYDRTPPDEIERLDTQLVVSLILTI
jgi:hypothetical protein